MKLLKEFLEYTNNDYIPIVEAIEESVKCLNLQSKGGKINPSGVNGAAAFFKANPKLVQGSAALALQAYDKYSTNKKNFFRLHAKSYIERRMVKSIVDALTNTGKFKIERIQYEKGGRTWNLKKVK